MAKTRVAVLFGGASKDNSVSLRSAYSVLNGLPRDKYEPVPIGITKAGRWLFYPGSYEHILDGSWETDCDCCSAIISPDQLHRGIIKILDDNDFSIQRIDAVFSVLHGKFGECGRIQGLCKLSRIAFVGCDEDAAMACTDKLITHLLLNCGGVKTPEYCCLERECLKSFDDYAAKIESVLEYPMYVRAASASSAIGFHIVRNRTELLSAAKICFSHHEKILIERSLLGKELECAVIGNQLAPELSVVGEIRRIRSEEDYKYSNSTAELSIPAELPTELIKRVQEQAFRIYRIIDGRGYAKISFKLAGNDLYCTKISNMPGLTEQNIFPRLMAASGYSYPELLDRLVQLSIEARE